MRNKHVDRWIAWVNEPRPHVALLGEPEVRRIVVRAIDDSSVVRFWILICGGLAGLFVGYYFATRAADPGFNRWQGGLLLAGFTVLLSLAADTITRVLIVRKIESLASGSRYY